MVKILYLSAGQFPSREANAIQVTAMCEALARAGHSVTLTGTRGDGTKQALGELTPYADIRLFPWPFRRFRGRLLSIYAIFLAARLRPDLVIARSVQLARTVSKMDWPILLELHGLPDAQSKTAKILRQLLASRNLVRIVCISQALANDLVAAYGTTDPIPNIIVVPDGANVGPPLTPVVSTSDRFLVGYFGHLYPGKGMEMLTALAARMPDIQFDVFGGTEADIAFWRVKTANLQNLCLHGYIPHAAVAERMHDYDVLIAPYAEQVAHVRGSNIGSWMSPLKLFEYMATGRAMVVSDLPVLREVVTHGTHALLCHPSDVDDWESALRRLQNDSALRDQIGRAARNLLETNYTWDRRVAKILAGF